MGSGAASPEAPCANSGLLTKCALHPVSHLCNGTL